MEWRVVAIPSALRNVYLMPLENRETTAACARDVVPLRKRMRRARARRTTEVLALTIRRRRSYHEGVIKETVASRSPVLVAYPTVCAVRLTSWGRSTASGAGPLPETPRKACIYAELHGKRADTTTVDSSG